MSESSAPAVNAAVDEMLAMADELEAQAEAWARALEVLGEERAAQIRRKAYELHLRLHQGSALASDPCDAGTAEGR